MFYAISSETAKNIPLDARPVKGHCYRLEPGGEVTPLKAIPELDSRPIYVSHYLTCPQAGQHSLHKPEPEEGA